MAENGIYAADDWIVHSQYGIGQIQRIEVKEISGEETRYYKVKTNDSLFWMPVDQMDDDIIRPLFTLEEIEEAIVILQNPAKEMSTNYKIRQNRIQDSRDQNTPQSIARIVRDLQARKNAKGVLNSSERNAFLSLKERLVTEWSIVIGLNTIEVEAKLDALLDSEIPAAA